MAEVAVQLYLFGLMLETESSEVLVCISVTHFIRKGKIMSGKARLFITLMKNRFLTSLL